MQRKTRFALEIIAYRLKLIEPLVGHPVLLNFGVLSMAKKQVQHLEEIRAKLVSGLILLLGILKENLHELPACVQPIGVNCDE